MLPTKFQVNLPFRSGTETKIDFQDGNHGGHLEISIGTILAIFDGRYFLPSFKSIGPSVQERKQKKKKKKKKKKGVSRWRPSWISDRNNFSYFWSTSYPDASYLNSYGINNNYNNK